MIRQRAHVTLHGFIAVSILLWSSTTSAQEANALPLCSSAACEDEALVISAVDAALDAAEFCRDRPKFILSTLHFAPYTSFSDGVRGRKARRGVPTSPPTVRLEDLGILSTRRFRNPLSIVDSLAVQADSLGVDGCLVVASPPTARDRGEMRVITAIHDERRGESVQRFVFLKREGNRWVVTRQTVGYRS